MTSLPQELMFMEVLLTDQLCIISLEFSSSGRIKLQLFQIIKLIYEVRKQHLAVSTQGK